MRTVPIWRRPGESDNMTSHINIIKTNIPPQVLLVTGGYMIYDDNNLDTTEILRPGSEWQVISSARLPRPMTGVRVITVDNRVLLFGELS